MDLHAPLGLNPRPRPTRRRGAFVLATIVALALIGGALAAPFLDFHHLKRVVEARLGLLPTAKVRTARAPGLDPTPTASIAPHPEPSLAVPPTNAAVEPPSPYASTSNAPPSESVTLENGVRVHRGSMPFGTAMPQAAPASNNPLVIDMTRQLGDKPKKDDRGAAKAGTPRVAIYVSGMGLSQSATRTAIDTLPAQVSLAFLPTTAPDLIEAARAKGHELLLQLPMENGLGSSAGPHALKPDEAPEALARDIDWATSRFAGYVGVTNLLGAPVMSNAGTMRAVLRATAARNLFFLDDGTSKTSVAGELARQAHVRETAADLVIDATAQPAVVRANLDNLVAIARRKGSAIGMATGLPQHMPTIASFAAELATKNVTLVPISVLAQREADVATNTR